MVGSDEGSEGDFDLFVVEVALEVEEVGLYSIKRDAFGGDGGGGAVVRHGGVDTISMPHLGDVDTLFGKGEGGVVGDQVGGGESYGAAYLSACFHPTGDAERASEECLCCGEIVVGNRFSDARGADHSIAHLEGGDALYL